MMVYCKIPPRRGYSGKIFWTQWGYDMINNEFVKVVRETDKMVYAVAIGSDKASRFKGNESPDPDVIKSRPYRMKKEYCWDINTKRYEMQLRGSIFRAKDLGPQTWKIWNRESIAFDRLD